VRYTRNKGSRPYRRKFPGFKDLEHMTSVIASLNKEQFAVLKRYAKHHLGDHIDGVPEHHTTKVKPLFILSKKMQITTIKPRKVIWVEDWDRLLKQSGTLPGMI